MDLEVNARIRALRKKHKFTQEELGKMLGYKTSTYSQIERKGNIDTDLLKKLAEVFDVDVRMLLYGEIPETKIIMSPTEPSAQPSEPPEPEIILGYKFINETLSVMEKTFIENFRRLNLEDIQEIANTIHQKIRRKN